MFGFRGRIGYISPSIIELNAYDFYRIAPEGAWFDRGDLHGGGMERRCLPRGAR